VHIPPSLQLTSPLFFLRFLLRLPESSNFFNAGRSLGTHTSRCNLAAWGSFLHPYSYANNCLSYISFISAK